jgi:predicted glycoside hydrolase/deacetylase ChbG (UPF0249 family)
MKGLLVINADDLGMSPEVNAGILGAIRDGFISDTSLLIKAPFTESAVAGLKAIGREHAGIHINLDDLLGWRPGGYELYPRSVLMEMLRRKDVLKACSFEAREQIERFLSFNLTLTHLDTHHHVHGFEPVFVMLMELMKEYAIPAMRFNKLGYFLLTREDISCEPQIYLLMEHTLREKGIYFCDRLLEGARKIEEVHDGITELVVHPSYGGESWRSEELQILMSDGGVESLKSRGIRLASFSDLIIRAL